MADTPQPKSKVRCPACGAVIEYDADEVVVTVRKSLPAGSTAAVKCPNKSCGTLVLVPFPESLP